MSKYMVSVKKTSNATTKTASNTTNTVKPKVSTAQKPGNASNLKKPITTTKANPDKVPISKNTKAVPPKNQMGVASLGLKLKTTSPANKLNTPTKQSTSVTTRKVGPTTSTTRKVGPTTRKLPLVNTIKKPTTLVRKKLGFGSSDSTVQEDFEEVEEERVDKWLVKPPSNKTPTKKITNNILTKRPIQTNQYDNNTDDYQNDPRSQSDPNRSSGTVGNQRNQRNQQDLYQVNEFDNNNNNDNNNDELLQQTFKPRKRELGSTSSSANSDNSGNNPGTIRRGPISGVPNPNPNRNDDREDSPQNVEELVANNNQLMNDCINIIIQCDPDQVCSKDELIARIAYQRKLQLKENGGIKNKNVIAMEKILSDLRNEQMDEGMETQTVTRKEQDKIVLENEMDEKVYKLKIDMTQPEHKRKKGDDPHCITIKEGKNWWSKENKKTYVVAPKLEAAFKKNPGNKAMPREMSKQLVGY